MRLTPLGIPVMPAATTEEVDAALVGLGARQWQVDATAQVVLDAFVDANQTIEPGVEPVS